MEEEKLELNVYSPYCVEVHDAFYNSVYLCTEADKVLHRKNQIIDELKKKNAEYVELLIKNNIKF